MRGGEGGTVLLLALNAFILLTAYYLIKPVREALILSQEGAEVKSYTAAGQVLLLAGLVPLYSRLAGRYNRRKLITVVTLFFVGCLAVFYALVLADAGVGIVFYLWVGIFSIMIVAQFWSFANDIYTREEGERLFVIIAFGASLGAVLGAKIAAWLIPVLGVAQLLLACAALLVVTIVITWVVDARERERLAASPETPEPEEKEAAVGSTSGFTLLLRNRYLLLIGFLMLFSNWVNTTGEYILGRLVAGEAQEAVAAAAFGDVPGEGTAGDVPVAPGDTTGTGAAEAEDTEDLEGAWIGEFYSNFFFVVNLVGFLVQLFLVSRIIKHLGVRIALLILPFISLVGNGVVLLYPVLRYVRWTKTAENATDYSLQNTVRNILFLPLTREEKYNGKQAVDTFFVRMGDVLSALLVFAGTNWILLGVRGFAGVNLALGAVWFVLAIWIGVKYRKLIRNRDDVPA